MKLTDRARYKTHKVFLKADETKHWKTQELFEELEKIRLMVIHAPNPVYQDIWYNASILQAADTRAKRDFIAGRMSLDRYVAYERTVYGTINA